MKFDVQPDVIYLDHLELIKVTDKQSVDSYLRELNEDEIAPLERVLFAPRLSKQLRVLVSALKPMERRLLQFRFWEDLTIKEISDEVGLAEVKVEMIIADLLAELQRNLFKILDSRSKCRRPDHV